MRLVLFLTYLFLFVTNSLANDEKNGLLRVEKSPFLKNFTQKDGFLYPAMGPANTFIHPGDPVYASKPQVLIKNGKTVTVSLAASGRIYECVGEDDSSYLFARVDHSPSHNYNIGGYYFHHKGNIYCYSGYGFWKNHGTLKTFNLRDREWDVIPMEKEIIPQLFPIGSSWYDEREQSLYVPFQSIVNSGIIGEENLKGVVEPSAWILDLKKRVWKKIGVATDQTIALITGGSFSFSTKGGLLVINNQELYLLNFKNNSISKSINASLNQSLLRAYQKGFLYQNGEYIYHFNQINRNADSVAFRISDFELLPTPIWQKDNNLLLMTMMIPIVISLMFLVNINKVREEKIPTHSLQQERKKIIEFSDIEKSLLKLLCEKTLAGSSASVSDINYRLGLKDKNTGLQKKVRSDVFNSINEKYSFLVNSKEPLIISIRSESDKRFFEFRLSDESIDQIKPYLS